jgi:flagellar biosynthesis/type III secretory pathway ATPase
MSEIEIQDSVIKAMKQMSLDQQKKLFEFVNSILSISEKPKDIMHFFGVFDKETTLEFEQSIKDSSQIDTNEW